jgi:hypothetical protein
MASTHRAAIASKSVRTTSAYFACCPTTWWTFLGTQPKQWRKLGQHHGDGVKDRSLKCLVSGIARRGTPWTYCAPVSRTPAGSSVSRISFLPARLTMTHEDACGRPLFGSARVHPPFSWKQRCTRLPAKCTRHAVAQFQMFEVRPCGGQPPAGGDSRPDGRR